MFKRRRRPGRWVLLPMVAMAAVITAWGFGLFRFAAAIPSAVADQATRTDAIIVLTGGSRRLSTGLKLLADDAASKLFVSGVYQGVDVTKLLEMSQRAPEELRCCVDIGHSAGNTAGNAAETAAWMADNGYRSLRLVTSNYHMPRSMMEFRHAMPDVVSVAHPVFPENVKWNKWWAWPGTASLIVGEYNKFLLAWVRHMRDRLLGGRNFLK
jgi:uncharacterized SAM-binding protein YcdF (DUF218 family)